jgi:hypothetical protein
MGRALGLILLLAAGLALFAYDAYDFALAVSRGWFWRGVLLSVLAAFLLRWAWRRWA